MTPPPNDTSYPARSHVLATELRADASAQPTRPVIETVAYRAFIAVLCVLTVITTARYAARFLATPTLPDAPGYEDVALSQLLPQIQVVDRRVHRADYDRDRDFGEWQPAGRCTTRHKVMLDTIPGAQLSSPTNSSRSSCRVTAPASPDPYSGQLIEPADVEIDHIFPLSAAWDMGAWQWDRATRRRFANDPINLVAVSSAANQAKSDALPADWMPHHPKSRCWYATRVAIVAYSYQLPVTRRDASVMRRACHRPIFPAFTTQTATLKSRLKLVFDKTKHVWPEKSRHQQTSGQ